MSETSPAESGMIFIGVFFFYNFNDLVIFINDFLGFIDFIFGQGKRRLTTISRTQQAHRFGQIAVDRRFPEPEFGGDFLRSLQRLHATQAFSMTSGEQGKTFGSHLSFRPGRTKTGYDLCPSRESGSTPSSSASEPVLKQYFKKNG